MSKEIKSKPRPRHRQTTVADLIKRLPLSNSLNTSQSIIVALSPLFERWLNQPAQMQRLSEACRKNSVLSSFQQGQLNIVCHNASNASELKHLKASLKDHLNSNYFEPRNSLEPAPKASTAAELVRSIKIRVDLGLASQSKAVSVPNSERRQSTVISKNSINALNSCSNQVSDPQLADALRRLAQTLEDEPSDN